MQMCVNTSWAHRCKPLSGASKPLKSRPYGSDAEHSEVTRGGKVGYGSFRDWDYVSPSQLIVIGLKARGW